MYQVALDGQSIGNRGNLV